MSDAGLRPDKRGFTGPTFGIGNRLRRLAWQAVWTLLARWTPPPLHVWRVLLLRAFGADVSWQASVYPDVRVWAPWNLKMERYATLARGVTCYNIARVELAARSVVSQGAHLCTGSHDYRDPDFPLFAKPITVGRRAWVCADAFVGPGVDIGEGAILAAGGVTFDALRPWTIYAGNPAAVRKQRPVIDDDEVLP